MGSRKNQHTRENKRFKKSLLAICIMACATPVIAQDQEETLEEVIVTGTRVNLQNAQEIKRNADTFVDAISAEDMGSLPDRSVLEAMQRVPGVSIERFAAANDPDHFGVEGSGAVIRGMSATRSEFNGRDSFTANSGRGLNFQDVPPELMSGVEVFKNQSADMVEGGIGGTVNLKTRKPFDSNERILAFNADYSYGDMAEEWTPTVSALYSDVWETNDSGRFGFMINLADSELKGVSHGIQSDAYVEYKDDYTNFTKVLQEPGGVLEHAGPSDMPGAERFSGGSVWMPNGSNLTMKNDDRTRKGYATSLQWESPDESFLATFQFMRSDARLTWKENAIKYQSGYGKRQSMPLAGTEFVFDDDGIFQSGIITQDNSFTDTWRGSNPATFGSRFLDNDDEDTTNDYIAPFYMPGFTGIANELFNIYFDPATTPADRTTAFNGITAAATPEAIALLEAATTEEEKAAAIAAIQAGAENLSSLQQFGYRFQTDNRIKDTRTVIDDFGLNFKWSPSDNLEFGLDLQHIEAKTADNDVAVMMAINGAMQDFDTRGDTPTLKLMDPWHGVRDNNPGLYGVAGANTPIDIDARKGPTTAVDNDGPSYYYFAGFSNDPMGDKNWFQDPSSYNWQSILDHFERSDGDSDAARFDVKYTIDDAPLITGVRAGVRYANRVQNVRFTDYGEQWGALAPLWGTPVGYADAPYSTDYIDPATMPTNNDAQIALKEQAIARIEAIRRINNLKGQWECVDWSDFHRGGVLDIPGGCVLHPNDDLVQAALEQRTDIFPTTTEDGQWLPANKREGVLSEAGGYFQPEEVFRTEETNNAAYVRVDFGSDETALRFNGNFGLRYVDFERIATGSVQFADVGIVNTQRPADAPDPRDLEALQAWLVQKRTDWMAAIGKLPGDTLTRNQRNQLRTYLTDQANYANDAANLLPDSEQAFNDGGVVFQDSVYNYDTVLPSLNVKVEFTDDLIGRFAAAKAIAMPDMEDVKNTTRVGASVNREQIQYDTGHPLEGINHLGPNTYIDLNTGYTGNAGNPKLGPMESTQYDASLEWYFANVGSLTFTLFYKDLQNFFVYGSFPNEITNNGVTRTVSLEGTVNNGSGTMQGYELAYQQFFDMLPAPWDGLGLQFNYSYIDSESVPNAGQFNDPAAVDDNPDSGYTGAAVDVSGLPLKGQSKETMNIATMYEKDAWSLRLAYNWRSRYLLTTRDVISRYPLWNDDAGFLDGSAFYKVNDNVTVGMQFTNLLNTQTKTIMILDGKGLEAGRSWFINDRRVALVVKGQF